MLYNVPQLGCPDEWDLDLFDLSSGSWQRLDLWLILLSRMFRKLNYLVWFSANYELTIWCTPNLHKFACDSFWNPTLRCKPFNLFMTLFQGFLLKIISFGYLLGLYQFIQFLSLRIQ